MGLTKTVYNPAALKAAQKTSEEALKKKQVSGETGKANNSDSHTKEQKAVANQFPQFLSQEALRLQQDVRKKKQEILEKHIETQKVKHSSFIGLGRYKNFLTGSM